MGSLKNLFSFPNYCQYIVLVNSKNGSLWQYDNFVGKISSWLTKLMQFFNDDFSFKCNQIFYGTSRCVKFGKLTWENASWQKWCHNSPSTKGLCDEWKFISFEACNPKFIELESSAGFPDCYFEPSQKQ